MKHSSFLISFLAFAIFLGMTQETFAVSADASLELAIKQLSSSSVTLSITAKNPSKQGVKSAQSWLKYDPAILKGDKIDTSSSPLDMVAPGENTFDEGAGIVKIGRATSAESITEDSIIIAEVTFTRKNTNKTSVSFYNFQVGNESNTSLRVFEEGFPVNILASEPKSIEIAGTKSVENNGSNTTSSEKIVAPTLQAKSSWVDTKRPKGLQVMAGDNYAILAWTPIKEASGYNVYYSNSSGRYLQRKSTGKVSEFYLSPLENGKKYYIAITAFSASNEETDYSDEVVIMTGEQGSSSAPAHFSKGEAILTNTKHHVQTGPEVALVLSISFGASMIFFLWKRRKNMI